MKQLTPNLMKMKNNINKQDEYILRIDRLLYRSYLKLERDPNNKSLKKVINTMKAKLDELLK